MITFEKIVQTTGCSEEGFKKHFQSFIEVCEKYNINTSERISGFLSNAIHETQGFRRLEENLNYSEKGLLTTWPARFTPEVASRLEHKPQEIANHVYGRRYGNDGNNDGWTYRGRGIFQTTFKDNYKLIAAALKIDCLNHPEILIEPPNAMLSAGYYWNLRKLNKYADLKDLLGMCRAINGGVNGYTERKELFTKLMEAQS